MSHDKIKAATRSRMARTGEPYAVARRAVIKKYQAAQRHVQVPHTTEIPGLGMQLAGLTAGSKVHEQLAARMAGLTAGSKVHEQLAARMAGLTGIGKI